MSSATTPMTTGLILTLRKEVSEVYAPPVPAEILDTSLNAVNVELRVQQQQRITLAPGNYLVRAHLPSGEIVRKSVAVTDDPSEWNSVDIEASNSPHEWLAWQHYLGNLGTQAQQLSPIDPHVLSTTWLKLWRRADGQWRAEPPTNLGMFRRNADAASVLIEGHLAPNQLRLIQLAGEAVPHRMIALPPSPAPIQLLIRATQHNVELTGGIVARIASLDAHSEALLRFLTIGAHGAADQMGMGMTAETFGGIDEQEIRWLTQAEEQARAKRVNPNAAALGFYYLLQRGAFDRMHDWPNNFANWFPWLPDSSVIHASQLLNDPQRKDLGLAFRRLIEAGTAGLPAYTAGFRYLFDNLCACLNQNTVWAEQVPLELITRVKNTAAATDWSQPRTTFYGPHPDEPDCTGVTGVPTGPGLWFILQ